MNLNNLDTEQTDSARGGLGYSAVLPRMGTRQW